ncbi:unnamed protein product, partial [Meganyctiphanes norvegica]
MTLLTIVSQQYTPSPPNSSTPPPQSRRRRGCTDGGQVGAAEARRCCHETAAAATEIIEFKLISFNIFQNNSHYHTVNCFFLNMVVVIYIAQTPPLVRFTRVPIHCRISLALSYFLWEFGPSCRRCFLTGRTEPRDRDADVAASPALTSTLT